MENPLGWFFVYPSRPPLAKGRGPPRTSRTGANERRCCGVGPWRCSAARCSVVPYPLWFPKPYAGKSSSKSRIIRSRATLATIDAAAIEAIVASPRTNVRHGAVRTGFSRPSTKAKSPAVGKPQNARSKAVRFAQVRPFASNSATVTTPMAQNVVWSVTAAASSSRRCGDRSFESRRPGIISWLGRMTAAATSGPAQAPRPTSSRPAIAPYPSPASCCSTRNVGWFRRLDMLLSYGIMVALPHAKRLFATLSVATGTVLLSSR